nr:hypothetical protein CFP56_20990 [Quercus suber]
MASLSQQGALTVGSSPGAAGALVGAGGGAGGAGSFGTPVGLGVEGITTPLGSGGVAMVPTLSELGAALGAGAGGGAGGGNKRNEDEERRAKMRRVLKRIGRRAARVSEEGIVRVSRRVGFQTNLDDEKELPAPQVLGNRTFTIAGKRILVDVLMEAQRPRKVEFMFASEDGFLAQTQGPAVATVLLRDLQRAEKGEGEGEDNVGGLAPTLDRFAANLERLARLDRWNSDHLDCFEALSGLHTSLQRLFEEEKKLATDVEVMCSKSGRPEVHARDELGLSLAYWQDPVSRMAVQPGEDTQRGARTTTTTNTDDGIFRLRLEVEPFAAALYPPIRISNAWLPAALAIPEASSPDGIPWQDPPPTLLPPSADAMAIDGLDKPPDLRFVARLDPPLVMEHYTALTFLSTFGIVPPAPTVVPPLYHVLLLDPSAATTPPPPLPGAAATTAPTTTATLSVLTAHGTKTTHHHHLDASKQEFGFQLHALPFSHPRQLVDALPVLRQWATLAALLTTAFPAAATHLRSVAPAAAHPALLTPPTTPPADERRVSVQCALNTTPLPTLTVTYPCPPRDDDDDDDDNDAAADVRFATKAVQVGLNGVISVAGAERSPPGAADDDDDDDGNAAKNAQAPGDDVAMQDGPAGGSPERDGAAARAREKLMATALERCADVGVWVEWLRSKRW